MFRTAGRVSHDPAHLWSLGECGEMEGRCIRGFRVTFARGGAISQFRNKHQRECNILISRAACIGQMHATCCAVILSRGIRGQLQWLAYT